MRSGAPPNGRVSLMRAATKGGKEVGTPHPSVRAYGEQPRNGGRPPYTALHAPSMRTGGGGGEVTPYPVAHTTRTPSRERWEHPEQAACNPSV